MAPQEYICIAAGEKFQPLKPTQVLFGRVAGSENDAKRSSVITADADDNCVTRYVSRQLAG
jgi:hypothetical protein